MCIKVKFLENEHVKPKQELLEVNDFHYGKLPEGDFSRGEVIAIEFDRHKKEQSYCVHFQSNNDSHWFLESELIKVG